MQDTVVNHSSRFSFEIKPIDIQTQHSFKLKVNEASDQIHVSNKTAKSKESDEKIATMLFNVDLLIRYHENSLAQDLLRQCLYLNSKQPEALQKLGSLTKQDNLKMACFKALLIEEDCFENLVHLGHLCYQQGQMLSSKEYYEKALSVITEDHPQLFEVYKNLGNIFMRENDFDAAEEFYNKSFAIDSRSSVLHVNLGTLEIQKSDSAAAVEKLRTALELDPKNDKAWVGLSMVHNEMGDFVLAKANIENAIDLNPRNRTAVQLAAAWAIRDQDLGFAISALENYVSHYTAAIDYSSEQDAFCDEEMSLLLIHLFCQTGQWQKAELELERLLLWNPRNEKLLNLEEEIKNVRKS